MLQLTPRIYKRNMKWSLVPKNKIDTIVLSPISNKIAEEETNFHTENFTAVKINDTEITLPIGNAFKSTHWRTMRNDHWVPFETYNYAKACVECVMASGERTFTVEQAITGLPSVSIVLTGTSSVITRGGSSFEAYPDIDTFNTSPNTLPVWIELNKTVTNTYLSGIYDNNKVWMNPWVRKIVPAGYTDGASLNTPTPNDILTAWIDQSVSGRSGANYDSWKEFNSFDQTAEIITMYPVNPSADEQAAYAGRLRMRNLSINMSCTLEKIDDHNFKVSWVAPVRLSYMAAARTRGPLGGAYDVDNYAFVDNITNVAINLQGYPYDTNKVDMSYSLRDDGWLTPSATNLHPIKIDPGEALTLGTYTDYAGLPELWTTDLSLRLLRKYQYGKYIIECDVPAQWALENNVGVNTQMQVCMQDGTYVKRNDAVCTFEVKTIEKKFNSNEFTYSLRLMEV